MQMTNPITHERLTIERHATDDHAGSHVRFTLPAWQGGPPPHYHARYDETFAVISGELEMTIGGAGVRRLGPGERVTVHAGTVHAFRNASDAPVTFRTEISAGVGFERFIRGWYGVAIDGHSNVRGAPRGILELVVLLDEGDINLPGLPRFLQRGLRSALRWVARLAGAEARLARWW